MKKSVFLLGVALCGLSACTQYHQPDVQHGQQPVIFPDYADVTFPVNIAPPNFMVQEEGEAYQVEIGKTGASREILIESNHSTIRIPERKWKSLLQEAAGGNIYFRVSVRRAGKWELYADITDSISKHPIDPFLVYRLLYPGYELWNEMGIYQRDLTSYKQTPVAENRNFGKQCINCHSFSAHSPQTMMMHVRGKQGGTVIYRNGQVEKVNPRIENGKYGATYPSWHPSGNFIAFSANEIQQYFHSAGQKPIEVSDLASDLMVYDVQNHLSFTDSLVCGDEYMETFPTWSPDGKVLYFCRAKAFHPKEALDSVRYDLCRVQFDSENKRLHTLECIYQASALQKSVSFPRISPDGRYLMFTQSDYGNFSIWHPESDLCLLDLSTGVVRSMQEINSDRVDSYHSWSSSGQWFVFSSKRMDGLWAHPYLSAFDPETGRAGKPFLLPQESPDFYEVFTYTFNLPELITEPIRNGIQLIKPVQ